MIETAVQTILAGAAGLTALVGTRIHLIHRLEDRTLPAVTHFRADSTPVVAMHAAPGVTEGRWQIDIWAVKLADLTNVAAQVRTAMDRYKGTPVGSGTEILTTQRVNEFDMEFEPGAELLHRVQEYTMSWRE